MMPNIAGDIFFFVMKKLYPPVELQLGWPKKRAISVMEVQNDLFGEWKLHEMGLRSWLMLMKGASGIKILAMRMREW